MRRERWMRGEGEIRSGGGSSSGSRGTRPRPPTTNPRAQFAPGVKLLSLDQRYQTQPTPGSAAGAKLKSAPQDSGTKSWNWAERTAETTHLGECRKRGQVGGTRVKEAFCARCGAERGRTGSRGARLPPTSQLISGNRQRHRKDGEQQLQSVPTSERRDPGTVTDRGKQLHNNTPLQRIQRRRSFGGGAHVTSGKVTDLTHGGTQQTNCTGVGGTEPTDAQGSHESGEPKAPPQDHRGREHTSPTTSVRCRYPQFPPQTELRTSPWLSQHTRPTLLWPSHGPSTHGPLSHGPPVDPAHMAHSPMALLWTQHTQPTLPWPSHGPSTHGPLSHGPPVHPAHTAHSPMALLWTQHTRPTLPWPSRGPSTHGPLSHGPPVHPAHMAHSPGCRSHSPLDRLERSLETETETALAFQRGASLQPCPLPGLFCSSGDRVPPRRVQLLCSDSTNE